MPDGIEEELFGEDNAAVIREYPSLSVRRRYKVDFDLIDVSFTFSLIKSHSELST